MRNNLKIASVMLFLVFLTLSCSADIWKIVRKSKKYETITPLNSVIEYYGRCYYSLPRSKQDIIDFLENWRKEDSASFLINDELFHFLKKESFSMTAFEDSVFIYFPSQKTGCCVIGHPIYWLEHPELYPIERTDYWWHFNTAAYRKDGTYCFDYNYCKIDTLIGKLEQTYVNNIFIKSSDPTSPISGNRRFTIYKAVTCYDSAIDSLFIISSIPNSSSLFIKNNNSYCSLLETENDWEMLCSDYFNDVKEILKRNSNEASRIILLLELRYCFSQ